MQREAGVLCTFNVGDTWVDNGTLARTRSHPPVTASSERISREELDILLDLGQITLDLAGIADPTPISDGSNLVISLGRGDWFGAGISTLSLLPYVGDLAKAGKLGHWAGTIHKSIALARRNARFAQRVRPALKQLASLLDEVPFSMIPAAGRQALRAMKKEIAAFLRGSARAARAQLIARYLAHWEAHIDRLVLKAPGKDRGVLWSKLGAAPKVNGKVTLEDTLRESRFEEMYELAKQQLTEKFSWQENELWEAFGKPLWTRVSMKYTALLEGRITARVKLGAVNEAISRGKEPIFIDELEEIVEIMQVNKKILSVELVDVVTGKTKFMLREDVLKSTRVWQ